MSNMDAKQVNKECLIESVRKFPCQYESKRNADLEIIYAVCDDSQVMTAPVLPP